jgi:MFS family permease
MPGVTPRPYRQVLAVPGVARLLIFAVLARVPITAAGVVLTLHVVTALHRGYAAAGLVAAVATVGTAVGGPWRGRAVDRVGLRRSLVPSVLGATLTWGLAPFVPYGSLVALAAVGGVLGLPVFSLVRQSLSVLVPERRRRAAFSLDGVGTELSFMIGPAVGVLLCTQVSTRAAMLTLAVATLAAGLGLMVLDPPTRSPVPAGTAGGAGSEVVAAEGAPQEGSGPGAVVEPSPEAAGRRAWFTPSMAALLAVAAGAAVVLTGTDVAVVAHLREHGAVALTGLVFVAWGIGSVAGGLVYGGLHRQVSPFLLLLGLAVLTVPVGVAPGPGWLLLTILPAAALCAPVIAATAEGVSGLVPERARGEAMGWHGSSLQVGSAVGAPLAGVFLDAYGAWSGFAAVGGAGVVIAGSGLVLVRSRRRAATPTLSPTAAPSPTPAPSPAPDPAGAAGAPGPGAADAG